jgi:hypothetical protein
MSVSLSNRSEAGRLDPSEEVLIRLRLWLGHVQHHLTDELLLVLQLLLLLLLLRSWLRLRLWHELHYRLQLLQQPRKEEETQACISSGEATWTVSNY